MSENSNDHPTSSNIDNADASEVAECIDVQHGNYSLNFHMVVTAPVDIIPQSSCSDDDLEDPDDSPPDTENTLDDSLSNEEAIIYDGTEV